MFGRHILIVTVTFFCMDWTLYFILATSVAATSLTWRTFLLDHKEIDKKIDSIPYIGNALVCGFCSPMWMTALAVGLANPLVSYFVSNSLLHFCFAWFSVGSAVLALRFFIVILMDTAGVLTHKHHLLHEEK